MTSDMRTDPSLGWVTAPRHGGEGGAPDAPACAGAPRPLLWGMIVGAAWLLWMLLKYVVTYVGVVVSVVLLFLPLILLGQVAPGLAWGITAVILLGVIVVGGSKTVYDYGSERSGGMIP